MILLFGNIIQRYIFVCVIGRKGGKGLGIKEGRHWMEAGTEHANERTWGAPGVERDNEKRNGA